MFGGNFQLSSTKVNGEQEGEMRFMVPGVLYRYGTRNVGECEIFWNGRRVGFTHRIDLGNTRHRMIFPFSSPVFMHKSCKFPAGRPVSFIPSRPYRTRGQPFASFN